MAKTRLDRLLPHYDPRLIIDDDADDPDDPEEGTEASEERIFRNPKRLNNLTDGFRIFTNCKLPAISFAGATTRGGEENAAAGAGYWIDEDDPGNSSIKLPAAIEQTRPNAEIVAAMVAVQTTPVDIELRLENPRGSVLNAMIKNLTKWEDRGWIGVPNRSPLRALAAGLRQRTGKTTLAITKTSPGNPAAAALARSGASKTEEDNIHLDVALDSQLPGARLSSLTQSIAYKGIKEMREPRVRTAIKDTFSFHPKSPTIWKSMRHWDIGRNIRNFLWKSMHGAHRLGKWWLNIPECEERANCIHCGPEETLDHILLECPSPSQSEVWKLTEQFWTKKGPRWPAVSMGTILGSGLAVFKDDAGKPQPALARLYKILMTELAHVIWKLRCDSVIGRGGIPPSTHEIDMNLTNRAKYGKQHALSPALVLDTWRGTLLDEGTLPADWLREPGVLVGITPKRSLRSPSPPIGQRGCNR
ncbi:ribonuclease H-like protein [Mycena leptocephala]|nr:ribonuclease H-like protein [Mycena leptocephala]